MVSSTGPEQASTLVAGRLNGTNAFMSGKLNVEGDLMLANLIESWFER